MNARRPVVLPFVFVSAFSSSVACSRAPEPDPTAVAPQPKPVTTVAAMPSPSSPSPASALAWDAPASFTKVDNPSPMRHATYKAPKVDKDGEAPELAVTLAGGSVDANVDRWVGQFDAEAKKTLVKMQKKLGPYDVTVVEIAGTFSGGGMPGAPATAKTGWALLAAIVPVGEQSWFFKMTGPEASVRAAKKDFDALLGTLRPGE